MKYSNESKVCFDGVIYKDGILNNKYTAAVNALKKHLQHKFQIPKKRGGLKNAIKIFAEHYNLTLTTPHKDWLLRLYISGENEFIKRQDGCFYNTPEWRKFKRKIHAMYGFTCMKCGLTDKSNCVDHIKPRSIFPELEYEIDNMQILCRMCNLLKSNRTTTDYRPINQVLTDKPVKQ